MTPIYLDHNATTPVAPEVRDAMLPCLGDLFGNPSSGHEAGRRARHAVEVARGQVADLLGAAAQDVVFTSGGTEANHLALLGVIRARGPARAHVVTSAIEHPSVLQPLWGLAREGVEVTTVPPRPDGTVDPDAVTAALRPDTVLVSLMHANNELGTLQPVAEVAAAARRRGVLVHTDAAQSAGKVPLDVTELGVDLLSLAGHKLYAPKGIGALWVRPGTPLAPLFHGGGQERGLRPGTEPVPGIVALGAACALVARRLPTEGPRLRALRDRLEAQLAARAGDVHVNGQGAPRLPTTSNVSFIGLEGALVLAAAPEVMASTGSACHSGGEPSHVLRAIGATPETIRGAVRLSLGHGTGEGDVERAVTALAAAARRLRGHGAPAEGAPRMAG
ncbi:MAG: cysteine desulfurase family protein [Actinomycetota bacterium]